MREITYLYRMDEWCEDSWEEWSAPCYTDLTTLAEELCEHQDAQDGEYPDEQIVWIKTGEEATPKKFKVFAEMTRSYSARQETT